VARKRKYKQHKAKKSEVEKTIARLAQTATPHMILGALNKEYRKYPKLSGTQAEYEFWVKCERSTGNLSSGMEKWLEEMLDEDDPKR